MIEIEYKKGEEIEITHASEILKEECWPIISTIFQVIPKGIDGWLLDETSVICMVGDRLYNKTNREYMKELHPKADFFIACEVEEEK